MGTSGVPFNIPKLRIIESIKKKKGVVTQICADLDISFPTYAKHIRDNPDLKQAIDDARNDFDTTICDMAETVLMLAMKQKDDMPSSLSSAKFVLNNKGRNRGYNPPTQGIENKDWGVNELLKGIKGVLGDSGSKGLSESGVEVKQPVPHSEQKRKLNKVSAKSSTKKSK